MAGQEPEVCGRRGGGEEAPGPGRKGLSLSLPLCPFTAHACTDSGTCPRPFREPGKSLTPRPVEKTGGSSPGRGQDAGLREGARKGAAVEGPMGVCILGCVLARLQPDLRVCLREKWGSSRVSSTAAAKKNGSRTILGVRCLRSSDRMSRVTHCKGLTGRR